MNTRQQNELEIQAQQILNARLAIEREFSELHSLEPRLSRLTLNEAEAIAWQSGVPHLVFPLLAEEKVKALANWRATQASIRRVQPGTEFGARWQARANGSTRRRRLFSAMVPPGSRRLTSFAAVLLTLLIVSTGCGQRNAHPSAALPEVTVSRATQQELVEWDEFTGRTEAVEVVEVRPRVSGHVQEVRFQSGQLVKQGDVLVLIDPRCHQAEFDRRQAEYDQARIRLENSEREANRIEHLLANKAISTEEAEAREARFKEAKAALIAAEAARDTARLDLDGDSSAHRWSRQSRTADRGQLGERRGRQWDIVDHDRIG